MVAADDAFLIAWTSLAGEGSIRLLRLENPL
jgi:hypothetical protein